MAKRGTDDNGFHLPRKALGQNFLSDQNIIGKIVAALDPKVDDIVLEVGPGRGALTHLLLNSGAQVHVVEFDKDLIDYWNAQKAQYSNLQVHGVDVLKFDLADMGLSVDQKIKLIGNLPYNISSPVLFHFMRWAEQLEQQVVMLQKEVVQRIAAEPGSKQYGRLSVMLQQRYQVQHLFNVPPGAFYPPPKVDSAIVRLIPKAHPEVGPEDDARFAELVKASFAMRRKTLRNNLKGLLTEAQIAATDIDPAARAETLTVSEFVRLSKQT